MITFDALTLKAFLQEQQGFLVGSRINKIQQPTRRELIFSLRNNGETKQFYVNINPQIYHLCFMSKTNAQKRRLEIPQKPPMFCMLLRKYLENARITQVLQPENERILEFYIDTYTETGDKASLCLAFELMGKYSNVILYNTDTGVIIGCAHNVGAEKSREREIYGGIPYVYPPKQFKSNILNYCGEINYDTLSMDFYLFSKAFAQLCKGHSLQDLQRFVQLQGVKPVISKDFITYSLYESLISEHIPCDSVNDMIDSYYSHYIEHEKFSAMRMNYKTQVLQKLKKVEKSITQMESQIKAAGDYDKYRLYGDLIMANLYNLKDFSSIVSVYDYENDREISINLDPLKTLKDNAGVFYKLYNKGKISNIKLSEFLSSANDKKIYLEQVLYSIEGAKTLDDLAEIAPEIEPLPQNTKKVTTEILVETLKFEDGTRIYIGKNNRQNDYIVSKLASEEDLWFHVHNCAGSHVLLKAANPTDELIFECAKLAKKYSSAKDSAKAGVIYTKRKYLRKPPAAPLGYVTYKNEQEIVV